MVFTWKILIFTIFMINTTLAVGFVFRFVKEEKPKININKLVLCIFITSAIWSFGMGMMSLQTDFKWAYIWRVFGIFGTFTFMIAVQGVMCYVAEISAKAQHALNGIALSGLLVFVLYITPGQTIFLINDIGTTFYFRSGVINFIYSLYFTVVCGNILAVTLHTMRHHRLQRMRSSAVRFIWIEALIFVGAIGDMVVPSLGYPALPGSAITQFLGVAVLWDTIHGIYKNQITITNMSQYIYYSLGIPVMVMDYGKSIRIMNDAALEFFNASSFNLKDENHTLSELLEVDSSVLDFDTKSKTCDVKSKNGIYCQLAISSIEDEYGDTVGYILLVNDLSEHYQVVTKLEEAKKASDAANLSKSLFLANMSHEIRTPMNAVLGMAQLAMEDDLDENAKNYFKKIMQAGDTLLSTINNILSISKIEAGKQELICVQYNPADLINDVAVIMKIQAQKKNLEFIMQIDESFMGDLYGDRDKIREILINLLANAVKYTSVGKIIFATKILERTEDEISIQIKVSDTGIGIREEDLDSIFDIFTRMDSRANSKTEGTGLGLSITKGIVDLMGGTIKVESVYGLGSAFTVELKQQIAKDVSESKASENEKASSNQKFKCQNVKALAVDDNAINREIIYECLHQFNIDADLAESGQKAVDLCKQNQYDIIFMDIMMPEMDGTETMKNIRLIPGYEKGENSTIIAFSADMIEGVAEERLSAGFDGFLGKPIKLDELKTILTKHLSADKIV